MGKNFLLTKVNEAYTNGLIEGWNKGFDTGLQFGTDIHEACLNDPAVVGKDTFGKGRMMKLRNATTVMVDKLKPSMYGVTDPEADVAQAHIDAKLKKVWGDQYDEWPVRYPYLAPCNYKGRKEK
jgi:hypothetical protein